MENDALSEQILVSIKEDEVLIVTIFVVVFDTKHGNCLEWNMSNEVDVKSVEFKALPSGAHNVEDDFVYFRQGELYGLACYSQIKVDSSEERGVRMKSVGVIGPSFASVFNYVDILPEHVRYFLNHPTGEYSRLEQLYASSKSRSAPRDLSVTPGDGLSAMHRKMQPDGIFEQFMSFFGEQIMVLWKLALLGKRVLFFSQPPLGDVCYRVLSFTALSQHTHHQFSRFESNPLFYVNIADIDDIQKLNSYVACTSEKIFQLKANLYDVFVNNWTIVPPTGSGNDELTDILHISASDKERFEDLKRTQCSTVYRDELVIPTTDLIDAPLISFFQRLNNRLLTVLESSGRFETQLELSAELGPLCLDLHEDRSFLLCLARKYGLNSDWLPPAGEKNCCPVNCAIT